MEKINLLNIYESIIQGKVYKGGPNFLNGRRTCPHCKTDMHRTPLNQQFIRVTDGKILVNMNNNSGELMISKAETKWHWACTGCSLSISNYK